MKTSNVTLNIFSIFHSLSGEVCLWPQGTPTIFIRLAGCNLQCPFCDTPESQQSARGIKMPIEAILHDISKIWNLRVASTPPKILITGGEPLIQAAQLSVLIAAIRAGFPRTQIAIETNGSFLISRLSENPPDCFVIDRKPASLGMSQWMVPIDNQIEARTSTDVHLIFKHIVAGLPIDLMNAIGSGSYQGENITHAVSAISPLTPADLWEGMRALGRIDLIVNTQLHKFIWPNAKKEV